MVRGGDRGILVGHEGNSILIEPADGATEGEDCRRKTGAEMDGVQNVVSCFLLAWFFETARAFSQKGDEVSFMTTNKRFGAATTILQHC